MTMFYQDDLENEWLQELEEPYLSSQPRFSDAFLLETFGDALDALDDKIAELKWERKVLINEIKSKTEPYVNREDIDAIFARWCVKHFLVEKLIRVEQSLCCIQRLKQKKNQPQRQGLNDEDIEQARNVSIIRIAEIHLGKLRKTGKSYIARCPFHEDNSPSLALYPDSNRFYCFGCNATGDVIAFAQKIFNCDFKTAIYSLIR